MLLVAPVRERVISAFHPHGDMDSNQFRVVVWRTGLEMIEAHPWFGVGPEEVKFQFDRYVPPDIPRPLPTGWYGHLHNIYIQYAAERGIPTMLMMMRLIGKVLSDFIRALRRGVPDERRWILHGAIAVILGVLVEGVAEHNLGDSEVLTLFLICISFGYLAAEHVPAES
jgi:O-antigen ligase